MHLGGHERYGQANGNYRTGRWSKLVTSFPAIGPGYQATLDDPAYASLKNQIAMLDARCDAVVAELVDNGVSTTWSAEALALLNGYRAATQQDAESAAGKLNALQELLEQGTKTERLWSQLTEVFEARRKLVDTEGKNAERASRMMNMEQANSLVQAMLTAVTDVLLPMGDIGRKAAGEISRKLKLIFTGEYVAVKNRKRNEPIEAEVVEG